VPYRSTWAGQGPITTHLAHPLVGCLPSTRLADDQRRVGCIRVENSRIMRSEKDVIDSKCQAGQDENTCWHDSLGPLSSIRESNYEGWRNTYNANQ